MSKFQFKLFFSIRYYFSFMYIENIRNLLLKIIYKKNKSFNNLNVILGNRSEIEFYDLVESKKIALVGPAYSKKKNGQEIDGFDLVIRMNAFQDVTNKEKIFFGSKTDIIYFNGEMFTIIENEGVNSFQISKFLCSRLNFSKRFNLNKNRSTRKLNLNLSGTNGFLQDIITDLMHYNFKEIKIFNVDFFLNKKLYFSNYSKPNNMTINNMFLTQSKLDLFSNINFIRNLEKSALIKVDSVLKNILKMSNVKIAKNFENLYKYS